MTLVLDASAVVDLLLRSDHGERVRAGLARRHTEQLFTVAHMDAEVFSGLARHHRAGELEAGEVTTMLQRLATMAAARLPITGELLQVAWSMRDNIAARDALYIAAAHALRADLVTTDQRLSRAASDTVARLE